MRIEDYAKQKELREETLRKWLQEDKDATFGRISTNLMAMNFNVEKKIVFKNASIHIELCDGYDKEYFRKIVEVLMQYD